VATSLDAILSDDSSGAQPETHESDSRADSTADAATTEAKGAQPEADEVEAGAASAEMADADESDGEDIDPSDLRYAGLQKAVRKERELHKAAKKRSKELERQIQQINAQLQALHQQGAKQPQKAELTAEERAAQYWADPEAYTNQRAASVEAAVTSKLQRVEIELATVRAKQRHNDFDAKEKAFVEAVSWAPRDVAASVVRAMMSDPDPAEYAYRAGAQILAAKEVSDPDAYRAKVRAEIEAELRGDAPASSSVRASQAPPPPKTIASARGSGARSDAAFAGPTSLDSILRPRKSARG